MTPGDRLLLNNGVMILIALVFIAAIVALGYLT